MKRDLIIAAVLVALGFGGGWLVNGWRLGTEVADLNTKVATLEGQKSVLIGANQRCAVNVADVKAGVKSVVDAGLEAQRRAAVAMDKAAGKAADHQAKASEALNRPPVPQAEWCAALQAETKAYADRRRAP